MASNGSSTTASPLQLFTLLWLLIIVIIFSRLRSRRNNLPALVLRRFSISRPGTPTLIEICGREAGVFDWLLTQMNLKEETSLKITGDQITFVHASLWGKNQQTIPLHSVASASSGYTRPVGYLIVAVAVILWGLYSSSGRGMAIGIIAASACFVFYVLLKKIVVSIETSGGSRVGISFSRSVIENIPVDIDKAQEVVDLINREIVQSRKR